MGYYYDGKYFAKYNQEQLVSLSLDINNLELSASAKPYIWDLDISEITKSRNVYGKKTDIVANVFEYLGWEEEGKDSKTDGVILREGYISSSKYNDIVEVLMKWLSQHGVELDVTCNGEDGENWKYSNKFNQSNFLEERLTSISVDELERYNKIKSLLNRLARSKVQHDNEIIKELIALI